MSRAVWAWGRLLVAAMVLAVLVWRLGTNPFLNGIRTVTPGAVAAAAGLVVLTTVCSAWRWKIVARGLGVELPMPKGVVRVYKKDSSGNAQFIGEDRIDHTPKNEKVRLKLGDAFDVTADKKQTDFRRRDVPNPWSYSFESAYEIVLKNAKKEAVTVVVREPVPGDWQMLEQSHPHEKVAAGTAEWKVKVPAEGNATLKYRVLVRY